jgi:hypothetical protein
MLGLLLGEKGCHDHCRLQMGQIMLATEIEILERGHIYEALSDIRNALAALIEDRYALTEWLL